MNKNDQQAFYKWLDETRTERRGNGLNWDMLSSWKAACKYKLSKVIWTNLQQARMWEMITVARLFIDRFPSDSFRKKEDSIFSMVAIKQWQKDFKELKKAINNDH